MNVGKDPFPRDEVTGLAAFDHLEPVGSLSVVPDESGESPVLTEAAEDAADELPLPAASANQQTAGLERKRPQHTRERGDATLPLDLTAMMPQIEHGFSATSPSATLSSAEVGSDSMSWDDDEATRVHSQSSSPAQLDMEWDDDDEPPTEMRPFAMFDAPPLAERHDWPEWNSVDEDDTTHYLPKATSSIRSATPTIRATTPPVNAVMPPRQNSQQLVTGGRPSPFPAPIAAPAEARRVAASAEAPRSALPAQASSTARPMPAGKTAQGLPPAAALPVAGAEVAAASARPSQAGSAPATFLEALKAKHRPSVFLAGGTAVGLLALYLIVHAIASVPRVGNAVLEVSPADAKVQVDGKDVQGSGSPYTVSELSVGSHELAVTKNGYGEYRGSFAVKAGESTSVPVIELAPDAREIGFSVRSAPDGAAVWVDGEPTDKVTPVRMTGIKPGQHRLQLKLAGYADYEVQLYLPEQTVLQLQTAKLVALPAEPQSEEPVVRSRRGRSRVVDAVDSGDTSLASARAARRARRASAASEDTAAASVAPRRRRDASASADSDLAAPKASASASGKTGTLRLNTRPWSQVVVDGRPVGNTPQPNLELSAGKHKLVLSNPSLGLSKNVTVTIKPGETNTQVINLAE